VKGKNLISVLLAAVEGGARRLAGTMAPGSREPHPRQRGARAEGPDTGFLYQGNLHMESVARAHVQLPAGPMAARVARTALRSHIAGRVSHALERDSAAIVSEIVGDQVIQLVDQRVDVHLAVAPTRLRVEVCGAAPAFDTIAPRDEQSMLAVLIVSELATRWGAEENHQTCVWFEVDWE
jgi:hypothetical protein